MRKLMLVCLCLFTTCSCSITGNRVGVGVVGDSRFIHHDIEGVSVWEDTRLKVVCYNFGSHGYSCIQNAYLVGVE